MGAQIQTIKMNGRLDVFNVSVAYIVTFYRTFENRDSKRQNMDGIRKDTSNAIFVGDLHPDVDELLLTGFFSEVRSVAVLLVPDLQMYCEPIKCRC
jgi:hypothetical protein